MEKKYELVKTSVTKAGRFEIVRDSVLEQGRIYPYSYIRMKNSVGVLAFLENELVLVRQYRHALGKYEFEIPGGAIEAGDSPRETAERELKEETGYLAKEWIELGSYYPSPGVSTEECFLFLAFCHERVEVEREPLEYMENQLVCEESFETMIRNGSFKHSMGLTAWMKYNIWRREL